MKVKFVNTEVDVWKLQRGSLVYCEHTEKHYYIEGFTFLQDATSVLILQDCSMNDPLWRITSLWLTWLEPH